MHHAHSPFYVGLSILVAAAGSWTALDLFRRVRTHVGRGRTAWLVIAALAMGASIWAMHFVAMLGFDPGSPVGYEPGLTFLSFVLAVLATLAAFVLAQKGGGRVAAVLGAGLVMGVGICLMHYVGMAALRTAVSLGYDPALVALSFLVAVGASTAALFVAGRDDTAGRRAVAALVLGAAISGMHYTAMAGLRLGHRGPVHMVQGAPPDMLALAVALACMSLLFLALMASLYDQRMNVMVALDAGRIGYWEAAGPPLRVELSDRSRAILGLEAGETASYERLLAAIGEPSRTVFDARLRQALAEGAPLSLECSTGTGGGWIDVRARPIGRGASRRLSGVILDISDLVQGRRALQESEARLHLALSAAAMGVWEWRLETNEMIYSDQARAICGFQPGELVTYDMVAGVTHPDDFPSTSAQAARALDPQVRDRSPYEYRLLLPGGAERWVYAQGQAVFEGDGGAERAVRYVGVIQDITDRKQAEADLRASEDRLRLAMEAGQMAVWAANVRGEVEPTPELLRIFGHPPEASMDDVRAGYLPGERDRLRAAAEAALERGERFFEVEFQYRRPAGELRWILIRSEIHLDAAGAPTGAIGVVLDVTERRHAQERLQLLAREVDHRANNLLTVVQGVIALTEGEDAATVKETITGRVQALAQAHKLLSGSRWEGAELRGLVREELLPYDPSPTGRAVISGDAVTLTPIEAQALAMVLHELATNAAKYGALSVPAGRVEVAWTLEPDGALALSWTERGGPPVAQPKRRGFGLTIIGRALSSIPGAESRVEWRKDGVACTVRVPRMAAGPATGPRAPEAAQAS